MYTLHSLAQITNAALLGKEENSSVRHLTIDSRNISFPSDSLFIALQGKRKDGHAYLDHAYNNGIRSFLISREVELSSFPEATFLKVQNTLQALQAIAAFHRKEFEFPVVGITGSNGKTWVKEWINQLLFKDLQIVRSPRSFNSQIGLPLSIWEMTNDHNLGLFEAGISTTGEMEVLEEILKPDIGIVTFIGDAHSDGFESRQQKIEEKIRLFYQSPTIIFPADQADLRQALEDAYSDRQLLGWGHSSNVALQIIKTGKLGPNTHITYLFDGQENTLLLPFTDNISVHNFMTCCTLLHHLGFSGQQIQERIQHLQPISMRMEVIEAANDCILINDSYSLDISSLQPALEFQQQHTGDKKKSLFLSDIAEHSAEDTYNQIAHLIQSNRIQKFVGIGDEVRKLEALLPPAIQQAYYSSTGEFIHSLRDRSFHRECILLKGARSFGFEHIVDAMRAQMHSAVLEIDLNAMLHNLQYFMGKLQKGVKLMVMVKASAYGSGSVEIAKFLEFQHVDAFAVAYTDEGVELRKAGIRTPIMVLNCRVDEFDTLIEYDLEPEVFHLDQLEALNKLGHLQGRQLPVHLKLDTGMHRLGFGKQGAGELLSALGKMDFVRVRSIFTHLAGTSDAEHDDYTREQVDRFNQLAEDICEKIGYQPVKHVLNSSGILRFPEFQYDMVRLGIGLYGIAGEEYSGALETVHTLMARISQVIELKTGDSVGYDRRFHAPGPMRIGTVNIGYADGLLRFGGNGRAGLIVHGRKAAIVGNVCMDMCMIDLRDIPGAKEGDEVEVFGNQQDIEVLASDCGTIPYEILSRISPRIPRLYHMA